jgi:hypothetical protein
MLMVPLILALSGAGVLAAQYLALRTGTIPWHTLPGFTRVFAMQAAGLIISQWIGYHGVREKTK